MARDWTPMQWPARWTDAPMLDLLRGSAITHLFVDTDAALNPVRDAAEKRGLRVLAPGAKIDGVCVAAGEWPGIKLTDTGAVDSVAAGPTGDPWVDSNGWNVTLCGATEPDSAVWVSARPAAPRLSRASYVIAVADPAIYGGRWIIALDDALAAGIAARTADALDTWHAIHSAAAFFAARKPWADYVPDGVFGIVSDFSGDNETLGKEILNLLARSTQQFRVLLKSRFKPASLVGLRAVIYADVQPPSGDLKGPVVDFVKSGGTLITGQQWGATPGASASENAHPRFAISRLGKGKIAVSNGSLDDPWLLARDAQVILSHRNELLRFWNAGAVGASVRTSAGRKQSAVQMVFYGAMRGVGNPTVRVAGAFKTARFSSIEQPAPQNITMDVQTGGVELQLPAVTQYAAVELD